MYLMPHRLVSTLSIRYDFFRLDYCESSGGAAYFSIK